MGKVSIVGAGMRSHPGVAAKVFRVLGENGINIEMISTSPIKISCVIRADHVPEAVKALHSAFELGEGAIQEEDPTGEQHHPTVRLLTRSARAVLFRHGRERRIPGRSGRRHRRRRLDDPRGARGAAGSRSPSCGRSPPRARRGARWTSPAAELEVQEMTDESIQGLDLILSSAGGKVSAEWAPKWIEAGAVVVDNTSYWRMHEDVPLVVAQVNDDAVADHNGLVANPNCTTMELMVALKPIVDAAGIERLIVSTYQSVSGTGREAIKELREQSEAVLEGKESRTNVYPHQVAFNVVPQVETFKDGDDYTTEERKVMAETRKILGLSEAVGISATCVRVPVVTGHSESVNVQTERSSRRSSAASCSPTPPAWSCSTIRATASTRCRSRPRAATRCWSGGSAATPRTSAASTSGWSATTSARGRRSTPCRSPSCSTSGISSAFPPAPA